MHRNGVNIVIGDSARNWAAGIRSFHANANHRFLAAPLWQRSLIWLAGAQCVGNALEICGAISVFGSRVIEVNALVAVYQALNFALTKYIYNPSHLSAF